MIEQWIYKGTDGIDSLDTTKKIVDFPVAFSGTNYVTNIEQITISGVAGVTSTKAENKITFQYNTHSFRFASIIAIGY